MDQFEKLLKQNFHTHTYRCNHACGDVIDYYNSAKACGFTTLGFSDHLPFPLSLKGPIRNIYLWRMRYDQIDEYLSSLDKLSDQSKSMKIYKGFECEYFSEFSQYYKELVSKTDYLILGSHFFYDRSQVFSSAYKVCNNQFGVSSYVDNVVEGLSSGYFKLLAHPDLFGLLYPRWDSFCESESDRIIQACIKYDIPLEVNGFGFIKGKIVTEEGTRYGYPWEPFWKFVTNYSKVRVVINSDAHYPWLISGGFDQSIALVKKYKLNLVSLF